MRVDSLLESSLVLEAAKPPGQRLAEALDLMDWGIRMRRQKLARDNPGRTDAEIDAMLEAWLARDD